MRRHHLTTSLLLAAVLLLAGAQAVPAGRQAAVATRPITLTPPEQVGFSSDGLKALDAGLQTIVDSKHLSGVVTVLARHGKVVRHQAYGLQDIDKQTPMQIRQHRAHLLDDQADCRRRDDAAARGRQVAAVRSDREAHPRVREPQGLHRRGCRRQADAGGPGAPADDGRADVAHRGLHLRPVRQHAGGQDVSGRQPAGRALAAGLHRQGGCASAALPARRAVGVQRVGGHPGIPGREAVGQAVPGLPAGFASSGRSA